MTKRDAQAPPSAAHTDALIRAGYVTPAGRLTVTGRAVLAQVLDGAGDDRGAA